METLMHQVSIAIPTYNRSDLLRRALLSALRQVFSGTLEILVVENPSGKTLPGQSTDAERLCIELADPRVRYVRNDFNLGMVGNWNRCLELATNQWILILHDDDWLSPYHLASAFTLVDQYPDLRLVGCEGIIERDGVKGYPKPPTPLKIRGFRVTLFHFLLGNPFFASGVVMDRTIALKLGGFDALWYPTMDHVFWLNFCKVAPCARLQHPLVHYFIGDNASLQSDTLLQYVLNDWKQRDSMIHDNFSKIRLINLYSRIKVYREKAFLEKFFRIKLSEEAMKEQLKICNWIDVFYGFRWVYFPISILLKGISMLFSSRLHGLRKTRKSFYYSSNV